MVDKKKLRHKIQVIRKHKERIEKLEELTLAEFENDDLYEPAAVRMVQVMVESVLDICSHIIAREGWGTPKTFEEIIQIVAENELIDPQKKEDFQNMARFRNRVVHLYDPISPEEIFKIIQDKTSAFDYFISQVVKKYF